jgi:hypothetical protein
MPEWMERALCSAFPTMPWVLEPQERSVAAERAMGAVCVACPVNAQCSAYVESREVSSGFWAGCDRTPAEELQDGAA